MNVTDDPHFGMLRWPTLFSSRNPSRHMSPADPFTDSRYVAKAGDLLARASRIRSKTHPWLLADQGTWGERNTSRLVLAGLRAAS